VSREDQGSEVRIEGQCTAPRTLAGLPGREAKFARSTIDDLSGSCSQFRLGAVRHSELRLKMI
jgi:hypothetical protein